MRRQALGCPRRNQDKMQSQEGDIGFWGRRPRTSKPRAETVLPYRKHGL